MRGKGKVTLIGAGPGDPGLITVKGKEALLSAQVVLYDRLVGDAIISMIPKDALSIDVGKKSDHHLIPQDEINALIMRHLAEGKHVARLKGGDPYLFGRGAEELEAVIEKGIEFEVIPGITSAIAVPAYAGIPVSHRMVSSSVHIITGHPRHGGERRINYKALVSLDATLVFLMGVSALPNISDGLIKAGMSPEMPAAIVENGTRGNQRKLISTIEKIASESKKSQFSPPCVIIVGEVCAFSNELDWFSKKPLFGTNILVTRPIDSAGVFSKKLRSLACNVTEYPCIEINEIRPPERILESINTYDWIVFTSEKAVKIFFEGLKENRIDIRKLSGIKFAAIGAKTSAQLEVGGIYAEIMPDKYNAGELAKCIVKSGKKGEKVLLYRAKIGTPELSKTLTENGFVVEDVPAYDTVLEKTAPEEIKSMVLNGEFDFVTFTSASTVHGFCGSLTGVEFAEIKGICIGGETAKAAKQYGINTLISKEATIDSMIDLILNEAQSRAE